MARQVVWTEPALDDLEAAAEFIARDSVNYAASFVQEVMKAADSLKHFPERGQIVPEWEDATIRELLVRSYRLVYNASDKGVFILALIHGARRKPRI